MDTVVAPDRTTPDRTDPLDAAHLAHPKAAQCRRVSVMRLRPSRHAGSLPGMRDGPSGKGERLRRKLFTILSAISLVLCAITTLFWIRSHTHGDYVQRYREPRDLEILSNGGIVMI